MNLDIYEQLSLIVSGAKSKSLPQSGQAELIISAAALNKLTDDVHKQTIIELHERFGVEYDEYAPIFPMQNFESLIIPKARYEAFNESQIDNFIYHSGVHLLALSPVLVSAKNNTIINKWCEENSINKEHVVLEGTNEVAVDWKNINNFEKVTYEMLKTSIINSNYGVKLETKDSDGGTISLAVSATSFRELLEIFKDDKKDV